jgi:hypothetical protein
MDMSYHHERDDGDDDRFALHARLADAVVSMLCAALLPHSQDTADHHADMMTALDLIGFRILQHNYRPGEITQAFQAIERHARDLRELFTAAVEAAQDKDQ